MIAIWSSEEEWHYTSSIFWTGVLPQSFLTTIPVSVFFLTSERILCLHYPVLHRQFQLQKNWFIAFCIISMSFNMAINLFGYTLEPINVTTTCYTFGCLFVTTGSAIFHITKTIWDFLNVIVGDKCSRRTAPASVTPQNFI
uniref:Uncharacterized protein n=1 Tax=Ditylenchus dipsaci TaxID=166011 RepID=A0A915DPZ6_9BILA